MLLTYQFSGKEVRYLLDGQLADISELFPKDDIIVITDNTIYDLHKHRLTGYKTVIIPSGEQFKTQETVNDIISKLITLEATRKSVLVGIGGGVVTDITGYVASVYMRGVKFGFVPTTILCQVDACMGGKNGIDVGTYKNLVGVIRQPEFIVFDFSLLDSLPEQQWVNGFAEIIKHGCIRDKALFELLESHQLEDFRKNKTLLSSLIEKNIHIKSTVVSNDEFENGERKLLNFGHTLGHAIENVFGLPHGFAISIGMVAASELSVEKGLLSTEDKDRIIRLLKQYSLPVSISADEEIDAIIANLKMDKKRSSSTIDFILLKQIGEALINPISITEINALIHTKFAKPALKKA